MLDANEGWILGFHSKDAQGHVSYSLLHYRSGAWTTVAAPITDIAEIAPVGPDDLWIAVTADDVDQRHTLFAHYHSGQWTTVPAPVDAQITALHALSPADIWASGSVTSKGSGATAAILHFDGTSWLQIPLTGDRAGQVVEMLSATEGWAFGFTQDRSAPNHIARAERFTNGAWQNVMWPYDDIESVSRLTRVADGSYWAIGGYMIDKTKANDANAGVGGSLFLRYADGVWSQYGHM
jgi:hypothetical protein